MLQYADLEKKVEDVHSSYDRTGKELKDVEARLREVQPLIKNISNYQHLKPVYDAFQKAKDSFNLNIPRYVDTFEPEPEIDLNEVAAEIRKLQSEIKNIDAELKPFFDELGLDFPFDVEGK